MPALAAFGTFIVGLVVGVVLMTSDHVFIGVVVAALAIPLALVVWITMGERQRF
jgi:hypothetical protein